MKCLMNLWQMKKLLIGWLAPLMWSPFLFLSDAQESKCAYVVMIMITYWFVEVIPMSVTALVPLVLFPVLGILTSNEVARAYANSTLMVFLGSLVAATAVEKSNLHVRIALKVILLSGTSPRRLLFGFMMTTAFLSMWISNLATVALMVPIINAALDKLANRRAMSVSYNNTNALPSDAVCCTIDEKRIRANSQTGANVVTVAMSKKDARKLRKAILLGVCYAANIGGTGTLTGSSTNLVLNAIYRENPISFSQWFFFNLPGLTVAILLTWLFMSVFFVKIKHRKSKEMKEDQVYEAIKLQYDQLGPLRFNELAVLFLFIFMLLLWFFRAPDFMPGWTTLFVDNPHDILDQVPAIFVVILFFLIPKDIKNFKSSPPLLDWKTTQERVSWGVMLLLGGGFAMAKACEKSGLSYWIGMKFAVFSDLPRSMLSLILIFVATFMTEPTSNTATCTVLLPVVKHMAVTMNIHPLYLMLPVTVACSYAFMLPVASGTNAIIFDVGRMKNKDMIVPGFFVKLICIAVIFFMTQTWGNYIFNFN